MPSDSRIAFVRLHRLVDQGWVPEFGSSTTTDVIWLSHPRIKERVILYPDGRVIGYGDGFYGGGRLRVETNAEFDALLAGVRRPNAWQRFWHRNGDGIAGFFLWLNMMAVGWLLIHAIGKLF